MAFLISVLLFILSFNVAISQNVDSNTNWDKLSLFDYINYHKYEYVEDSISKELNPILPKELSSLNGKTLLFEGYLYKYILDIKNNLLIRHQYTSGYCTHSNLSPNETIILSIQNNKNMFINHHSGQKILLKGTFKIYFINRSPFFYLEDIEIQ